MLLRVIFFIFLSYQVLADKKLARLNSSSKSSTDVDVFTGNPAVTYFWGMVNETLNTFIKAWNLDNPENVRSRETIEEIWFAFERSLKHPVGAQSWILIFDHIKDTLTHATARDTFEKVFTTVHQLLLRDSFPDVKKTYQELQNKEEVNKKWGELRELMINELITINNSEKMKKSLAIIKTWIKNLIKDKIDPVKKASRKLKKHSTKKDQKPNLSASSFSHGIGPEAASFSEMV